MSQLHLHEEEDGSMSRLLPDDVLAAVLRLAAPRGIATARRVCRSWRALVDERHLLHRDLVPRSLSGFFINYNELPLPELFHRPSSPNHHRRLTTSHRRRTPNSGVLDHCNGVLLLFHVLLNPATGWWAPLPGLKPPPRVGPETERERFYQDRYLVFDPAVSPHCEVFLVPRVPSGRDAEHEIRRGGRRVVPADSAALLEMEWPPSPLTLNVFSTATGGWEERSFSREGDAAGTVAEMQKDQPYDHRHAVYWRGALYVHSAKDFVMRLSLSDNTYRMIQPPSCIEIEMCELPVLHLGRSEKGVYCALADDEGELMVWILEESRSRMQWALKHKSGRGLALAKPSPNCFSAEQVNGPWILDNANGREYNRDIEVLGDQGSEWNSDDEDVLVTEDRVENQQYGLFGILGFHPYKEIIFLHRGLSRGLAYAYHLNTSKLESLGNIFPKQYSRWAAQRDINSTFPYTPCNKMAELTCTSTSCS